MRHRRTAHNKPHSCFYLCCKFKWTRPCEYRTHLEKRHPEVDSDKVLGKPAGHRSKSTIIGRDLPIEYEQSKPQPGQRPMTPPVPAMVTQVPSPPILPVVYNHQPEYAHPAITTRKHARVLEFFGATDAPLFSSAKEFAQSVNDLDQGNQIWLVYAFLYIKHVISNP